MLKTIIQEQSNNPSSSSGRSLYLDLDLIFLLFLFSLLILFFLHFALILKQLFSERPDYLILDIMNDFIIEGSIHITGREIHDKS